MSHSKLSPEDEARIRRLDNKLAPGTEYRAPGTIAGDRHMLLAEIDRLREARAEGEPGDCGCRQPTVRALLNSLDESKKPVDQQVHRDLTDRSNCRYSALESACKLALALFAKDHAIDRFDWGNSCLRAQDIRELNETPLRIREALVLPPKGTTV